MLNLHYFIVLFSFHEIYYIYYYFHVRKIYFKVYTYTFITTKTMAILKKSRTF